MIEYGVKRVPDLRLYRGGLAAHAAAGVQSKMKSGSDGLTHAHRDVLPDSQPLEVHRGGQLVHRAVLHLVLDVLVKHLRREEEVGTSASGSGPYSAASRGMDAHDGDIRPDLEGHLDNRNGN